MAPKKQKKSKKPKQVDWTDEAHFDKARSIIYIEHSLECPIYSIKADEFCKFLQEEIPNRMFVMVPNAYGKQIPRIGAFEIEFSQNARTSRHALWSGMDRGPPRRDKFPNFESLLPGVQKVLKKFYAEKVVQDDDDDEED